MKFFHTSDWHLGRMLYGRSLLEDQRYFLEQVFLPAVERERPDCILLAGDIYDRQIAPPEAIRLFDRTLSRLTELNCKVAVISGNHDGSDRIAILKNILRKNGVFLATELSDAFSPIFLEAGEEKAQLFLLPYLDSSAVRDYFQDDTLRGEGACMARVLSELEPLFLPDCLHILMTHCFAAGSAPSDSESTMFVGGSGEVPPELFSSFDYAALGHLHGPQRAGKTGRYSGSPLKYSVDEESQKKSFLMLESDQGALKQTELPIVPLRDVRRITGLFQDLLSAGQDHPREDYVELELTDKAPILLAAERLRPYYPNLLSVTNRWAADSAVGERAQKLQNQTEDVIFRSFLKDVCNIEAAGPDLELFSEILREVDKP